MPHFSVFILHKQEDQMTYYFPSYSYILDIYFLGGDWDIW